MWIQTDYADEYFNIRYKLRIVPFIIPLSDLFTYLASSTKAMMPAAIGADADVPVCSWVQLWRISVVTWVGRNNITLEVNMASFKLTFCDSIITFKKKNNIIIILKKRWGGGGKVNVHHQRIDYLSTTAQGNALHFKFTLVQYRNTVVGGKMEIQLLQLTAMQLQWTLNTALHSCTLMCCHAQASTQKFHALEHVKYQPLSLTFL